MNLVIAQVLCYVGKRLCVRCSHPCMVPIVVPMYKHARSASMCSAVGMDGAGFIRSAGE
jgi:hypothetical protein